MMEQIIIVFLQALLVFLCNGEIPVTLPTHCTQTARSGLDYRPRDISPTHTNGSEFMELPINSTVSNMNLEICPNNVTLKISWKMKKVSGSVMTLCFKIKSPENGLLLDMKCAKFDLQYSKTPTIMTCWFPMEYMSDKPIISAVAGWTDSAKSFQYYGELNTTGLDPSHICTDICEVSEMSIKPQISCNDSGSILFDERINIKSLSFSAFDSNVCNDSSVVITGLAINRLQYKLNCTHSSLGHVKVLYSINGKYCLKYQSVTVICETNTKTTKVITTEGHVDDFQTFVVFGIVCMIVITVIFVLINFVAQRLRHFFKVRRRYNGCGMDMNGREGLPLHSNNCGQKENIATASIPIPFPPVDAVIKREYRKRVDSMSSTDAQSSLSSSSFRGQTVHQLHRCMTVALLENTESFYRKKILFLPTPFDTFSRDATNLMKAAFFLELNIPTQCCFDREVFQRYLTGDRYKWIEAVLGDYDKIVVFLCFTTICGQKGDSMIEDVLNHLSLSKIRPHCRVAFLHITDSSANLEKNHHGDSFHLSDTNSYRHFMGEMLNYCGRNPASQPDILYRLINCEASRHFLRLIGMEQNNESNEYKS